EQGGDRPARAPEDRRALRARPYARRQEGLERDGGAPEGDPDDGRIDGRSHGLSDFLTGERLLLRLEREVAHLNPGDGQGAGVAARRSGREPDVERLRIELGFRMVVV